jgi:hypothetical protein
MHSRPADDAADDDAAANRPHAPSNTSRDNNVDAAADS